MCLPVLAASGCRGDDGGSDNQCVVIGAEGGLVTSADSVLTLALRPGALAEDTEICVRPSDEPPPVFGPAYRVRPTLPLALASTVTYRHELPADASSVTIGRVDRQEFEAGEGRWIPLPQLSVDVEDGLVKSSDTELSLFYALLDEGGVPGTTSTEDEGVSSEPSTTDVESSTSADPSTTTTGDETTTTTTTAASVDEATDPDADASAEDPTTTEDSGTEDTGVVYPPECDDLFMGPYDVVYDGMISSGGSEDLAMSGNSNFVVVDGDGLVVVDQNAAATDFGLAVPFTDTVLGLRYRADGDLVAALRDSDALVLIHPDGTTDPFFDPIDLPNGVYPDAEGYVWVTSFFSNSVLRVEPDGSDATLVTDLAPQANGIVYDDLRQQVFWTLYEASELWRAPIADDGTPGAPVMVADLDGYSDGLTLDICGNFYVVDQNNGGPSRIDRVFVDAAGEQVGAVEEIAGTTDLPITVANAQFGYGGGFVYEDALYAIGVPGTVYVVDVQIAGHHPIPPI